MVDWPGRQIHKYAKYTNDKVYSKGRWLFGQAGKYIITRMIKSIQEVDGCPARQAEGRLTNPRNWCQGSPTAITVHGFQWTYTHKYKKYTNTQKNNTKYIS